MEPVAQVDLPTNVTFSPARNHAFLLDLDISVRRARSIFTCRWRNNSRLLDASVCISAIVAPGSICMHIRIRRRRCGTKKDNVYRSVCMGPWDYRQAENPSSMEARLLSMS
jgi:hypothetical protein